MGTTRQEGSAFDALEATVSALGGEQERGRAFERGVLHFLRHDPRLDLKAAWLWMDWPARQRRGLAATDLVAEDRDGTLIAVQAKFRRDPHHRLRYFSQPPWGILTPGRSDRTFGSVELEQHGPQPCHQEPPF